ncbi:MAG: Crp/Fnr family transcriptional regulator [Clostridia bacterium]
MVSEKLLNRILATNIFFGTNKDTFKAVLEENELETILYKKGDVIYSKNDFKQSIGFIIKGSAQVIKRESGVIISTLNEDDVFGGASLFSTKNYFINDIIALKDTKIIYISKTVIIQLMHLDSNFLTSFIRYLTDRIYYLNERIVSFTGGSAENRLANYLLSSLGDYKTLELEISISKLATSLDIGRASLYRAFDKFTRCGCIEREGKRIRLLNEEKLKEFLPI